MSTLSPTCVVYHDLTESTNIDLGFSHARGHNDLGSEFPTQLCGMDLYAALEAACGGLSIITSSPAPNWSGAAARRRLNQVTSRRIDIDRRLRATYDPFVKHPPWCSERISKWFVWTSSLPR